MKSLINAPTTYVKYIIFELEFSNIQYTYQSTFISALPNLHNHSPQKGNFSYEGAFMNSLEHNSTMVERKISKVPFKND